MAAAFFVVSNDVPEDNDDNLDRKPRKYEGILLVESAASEAAADPLASSGVSGKNVLALPDEGALIDAVVEAVREHDPGTRFNGVVSLGSQWLEQLMRLPQLSNQLRQFDRYFSTKRFRASQSNISLSIKGL